MKRIKLAIGALAISGAVLLNIRHAYENYGLSRNGVVNKVLAAITTTSGNTCCSFWGGTCNEKLTPREADVKCKIITTTYRNGQGTIVGYTIIKFGSVVMRYTGTYSTRTDSDSGYTIPKAPIVMCPTSGSCNNCEEYRPSCT